MIRHQSRRETPLSRRSKLKIGRGYYTLRGYKFIKIAVRIVSSDPKKFAFWAWGDHKKASKAQKKRKIHKKNVDGAKEVERKKSTHANTPPGEKGPRLRDSKGRDSGHKKKKKRGEERRRNT